MALQVAEVQKALRGADYPASPSQLAETAERNGADSKLVDAVRGINKGTLTGPDAVMQELKGSLTGQQ